MTFIVLMIICGFVLNEFVIRPWKRADQRLEQLIDLDTMTEQETFYND